MAKLMVMIDIPDHDYQELSRLMKERRHVIPGVNFNCVKSKDGYRLVQVDKHYLKPLEEGDWLFFELIGVRP